MARLGNRFLIVVLAAALATGCVTTREVKGIVAETNAAMVDAPRFEQPGGNSGDGWREPVGRIDRLIAKHPDETVLVNTLMVRQAMLLTVYGQDALADEVWGRIEERVGATPSANDLPTTRDRTFFALRDQLVWWFVRAGGGAFDLTNEEIAPRIGAFEEACDELPEGDDTRLYLETMRANVELKLAHSSPVGTQPQKDAVRKRMVDSLARLHTAFAEDPEGWVEKNFAGTTPAQDMPLYFLRHLAAYRDLIRAYRSSASRLGLDATWAPAWINDLR